MIGSPNTTPSATKTIETKDGCARRNIALTICTPIRIEK
jgi:hypothetical protein